MTLNLDKEEFYMIADAMTAIRIAECTDFVRNFNDIKGFLLSDDERMSKITKHINYEGHSGASMACAFRRCQYYLQNPSAWESYQQQYS